MKIGVIVAMDAEFRLIHDLLEEKRETCIGDRVFVQGRSGTKTVVLAKSGIGKVCSALGTMEMIRNFVPNIYLIFIILEDHCQCCYTTVCCPHLANQWHTFFVHKYTSLV